MIVRNLSLYYAKTYEVKQLWSNFLSSFLIQIVSFLNSNPIGIFYFYFMKFYLLIYTIFIFL
jgi:hypothetical protein